MQNFADALLGKSFALLLSVCLALGKDHLF